MPPSPTPRPLAIVTGASSGIGEATAVALAEQGYRVVLIARRRERLEAIAARLGPDASQSLSVGVVDESQGLSVGVVEVCDLSDADAVEPCMRRVIERHGPVEVLVHSAGYGLFDEFLQQSMADLRRLMEVHYFAAAATVRCLLPGMLQRGRGHVILVGSMSTKCGPWGHTGYAAAKCALTSLAQTLHAEYAPRGVNVSVIHPGLIVTDFFNHPSYAKLPPQVMRHAIGPERIAQAIVRLLHRPRVEMVVPWFYRTLDWLRLIWPWMVHDRIARYSAPAVTAASDAPAPAIADKPAASDVPS